MSSESRALSLVTKSLRLCRNYADCERLEHQQHDKNRSLFYSYIYMCVFVCVHTHSHMCLGVCVCVFPSSEQLTPAFHFFAMQLPNSNTVEG